MGFTHKEIDKRFDEIVAFAELEQFIDTQVKYYSSGMYIRLGFATAVSFDPDILLVDEVLAVGDERFQAKCLDRIHEMQGDGCTILFVSHAVDMIRRICDGAAVLHEGKKVMEGPPGEAIRAFREVMRGVDDELAAAADAALAEEGESEGQEEAPAGQSESEPKLRSTGGRLVALRGVSVHFDAEKEREYLLPGEGLEVMVDYEVKEPVDDAVFGMAIHNRRGDLLFASDTEILGLPTALPVGPGRVSFRIDAVPLLDGTYDLTLGIRNGDGGAIYDWREGEDRFSVMNPTKSLGEVFFPLQGDIKIGASQ